MNSLNEIQSNLDQTISQIEKLYGKGTIMRLSNSHIEKIPVVSTGSLSLDIALGVGGLPQGRIVEIYGPESSGKTTLALHCIAEVQKNNGIAAFIDAEHAFDKTYAENLGIDTDNLLISQPDNGEQALEIVDILVKSSSINIIVIDSVAALVPKAELEGEMGESKIGSQARLMSQALRKLTSNINKSGCCCIFINQLREKIGVMFGNPETTPGGNALKYFSSIRIDIRKAGNIKEANGNQIGNNVKIKIIKNKVAPPFKVVETEILYGKGINKIAEIMDMAISTGMIKKSGSWFAYNENNIGQGREAVHNFLVSNPTICVKLESLLRENLGLPIANFSASKVI